MYDSELYFTAVSDVQIECVHYLNWYLCVCVFLCVYGHM